MADNYTNVSISGYNANPPPDDATTVTANALGWSKHKDKLGDPLKTAIEDLDTNVDAAITALEAFTPPGLMAPYAGSTAPSGWLLCDNTDHNSVTDTTLANLFSVIGTTYGGTGASSFRVPDLRGRVVAGQDDMGGTSGNRLTGQSGGVDGDVLGATGGAEEHTLVAAELAAHKHTAATASFYNGTSLTQVDTGSGPSGIPTGASANALTGNPQTSGQAHNNVQPTFILNYIIKK